MATVIKKVTAGYHSCTGPEQCLSCGLVGQCRALGEIQDKHKHRRRTMALTLFTIDAFPSAAGRTHTESPRCGRAGYHTPRPLCPLSSTASDTSALHRAADWVSGPFNVKPPSSSFPKAFVRYIISSDSCSATREGNIMPFFCQCCWYKAYFGRVSFSRQMFSVTYVCH